MAERRKSYAEQIKDSRWQQKRLEIMGRDKFRCRNCLRDDHEQLHVHHKFYKRGTMVWEYPDWSMVTLCHECHELAQCEMEAIHAEIARISHICLLGYVRGYALGVHMFFGDREAEFEIESKEVACGIGHAFRVPSHLMEQAYLERVKITGDLVGSVRDRLERDEKYPKPNPAPLDTDMCFV